MEAFATRAQTVIVRRLTGTDARTFREVRLDGLKAHPDAFASSWEDEAEHPLPWFEERLESGYVAGCELDGRLVGVAGLHRGEGLKTRHRGALWGVYVTDEARGRGVGSRLIERIIAEARGALEELSLSVAAHNEAAIRLYESFGFVRLGVDPHAFKVGDTYVDEVWMRLAL